jgi:hypothetical protein
MMATSTRGGAVPGLFRSGHVPRKVGQGERSPDGMDPEEGDWLSPWVRVRTRRRGGATPTAPAALTAAEGRKAPRPPRSPSGPARAAGPGDPPDLSPRRPLEADTPPTDLGRPSAASRKPRPSRSPPPPGDNPPRRSGKGFLRAVQPAGGGGPSIRRARRRCIHSRWAKLR